MTTKAKPAISKTKLAKAKVSDAPLHELLDQLEKALETRTAAHAEPPAEDRTPAERLESLLARLT